jgi:hypothetical protein
MAMSILHDNSIVSFVIIISISCAFSKTNEK